MVTIAEAIIDEGAVVIEALHALVAVVAMPRVFGPQILTIDADIV